MSHKFQKYFRVSKSDNPLRNVSKTLLQTIVFWGFFLFIIPGAIHTLESAWGLPHVQWIFAKQISVLIFLAAGTLGITSGLTMAIRGRGTPLPLDGTNDLVISGPYRYVRNPMAIAGLTQGLAVGIWLGSWGTVLYVAVGFILWNGYIRPIEEQDLKRRFGKAYEEYCEQIKCWIPNWRGYRI